MTPENTWSANADARWPCGQDGESAVMDAVEAAGGYSVAFGRACPGDRAGGARVEVMLRRRFATPQAAQAAADELARRLGRPGSGWAGSP